MNPRPLTPPSARLTIVLGFAALAASLCDPRATGGPEVSAHSVGTAASAQSGDGLPPLADAPTRADLAAAYLEIDATASALMDGGVPKEVIVEANRRFDAATLQFFAGRPADVIRALGDLAEWMTSETAPPDERALRDDRQGARQLLASLSVDRSSHFGIVGEALPRVTLVRTRAVDPVETDAAEARTLIATAVPPDGTPRVEVARWALPAPSATNWQFELGALASSESPFGRWQLEGTIVDGEMVTLAGPRDLGELTLLNESPSALRTALRARFEALGPASAALRQAFASFDARLELLVDEPSATASAQFLSDPHALATALSGEIARLESGANPYAEGSGDWWRSLEAGTADAPVRIRVRTVVPDSVRPGALLVIALHGAGGDENMFVDGYGAGMITRLARDLGAVVASPSTVSVALAPITLRTIIDTLVAERQIDPKRVVIVGHSMGAAAAMRAVDVLPGTFRAWAAIGGAGRLPQDPDAAGVIVLGGIDPLASPARLLPGLRAPAEAAGVRIEVLEEMGHTLIVGPALVDIMHWFAEIAPFRATR